MGKTGEFDTEIPRLVPRPEPCETLRGNVRRLDGIWKFCHACGKKGWHEIEVPSFIGPGTDEAEEFTGVYSYRKRISLLPSWKGYRKILKLEGINGHAKVYVDGVYVGEHWNGFLTWTLDITEVCAEQREVLLQIDVDETEDRVGTFYHGGLLHSVWLYLLPQTYLSMLHISTVLDQQYRDAVLVVDYSTESGLEGCEIEGIILDPFGYRLENYWFREPVENNHEDKKIRLNISTPLLWDAEHPHLYTIQLRVCRGGEVLETVKKKFGFRQIERRLNRVYVNGQEIKLHGVCRHEVSAYHGRCITEELIDQDVRLFKEANCNYIRTSHYSPSEYFLDACDREGIYIEDELGLAFVAKSTDFTQRDPRETQRFLSHFQEAMARDYSHPCVLIWSLCNESFGGYNFDVLNRYIHRKDPTRLTKFSYPMTMQPEHEPVDVWSIHYTNQDVDLSEKRDNVSVGLMDGKDVPVIHDEYAHIPCYNREEHRRDPNVRNFWGLSIQKFWDNIWKTEGALGGAIWAGIDETDGYVQSDRQLEWGIIDIWRRKKPEFYLVRKAYSPIVIHVREIQSLVDGSGEVEVENRFCHTDLSETVIQWEVGEKKGRMEGPEVPPGKKGVFFLPDISGGEWLTLIWYDASGRSVDEYRLKIVSDRKQENTLLREKTGSIYECWKVIREENRTTLKRGKDYVVIDEVTGRISEGVSCGEKVLAGGPDINMSGVCLGKWKKEAADIFDSEEPEVVLSGWYADQVKVTFHMQFYRNGEIKIRYRIDQMNISMPDRIKLRVSVSGGGLNEIGIGLTCVSGMDVLYWKRRGQWTIYPQEHIARNEGTAFRFSNGSIPGREPQIPWKDEMTNCVLNGKYDVSYKGTNDFRAQRENIYEAKLFRRYGKGAVCAVSDGSHSVRVEVQEPADKIVACADPLIRYRGAWSQMEDPRAGKDYKEMWSKDSESAAEIEFKGTGIVWYGPVDVVYGYAKVYVDGQLADDKVLQRINGVDFPGSADGYDKKFHYPVYSVDGLEKGKHVLRIEPAGKGCAESRDTYVVIEKFRILDGTCPEPVQMWINNACNYPMISWGNYCRPPILVGEGYENQVVIRLG